MRHERALIGLAIIGVDKHLLVDVQPSDFGDSHLGEIWAEIIKHQKVDITVLANKFDEAELSEIVADAPVPGSIKREAERVKHGAYRRRLRMALIKSAEMVDCGAEIGDIAHYVMQALDGQPDSADAVHISDAMIEAYSQVERSYRGESVNFVPTGYSTFDETFGGLQQNGLVIVAGRPSMGKTAFAMGLASNAGKEGHVLIVSMEMSRVQLAMRFLASERNIDLQKMMQGKLSVDDFRMLADAVGKLKDRQIYINDVSSRDVAGIAAEARRFKRAHGSIHLLVIDYLTLLRMPGGDSMVQQVGKVSRAFKVLAGELGCPIVVLSQLNRDLEKREDKRPRMSDLRDSGAIEQDADQIIFPFRDEVYRKTPENEGIAEIIMAKNRNGQTGLIRMAWRGYCAAFAELAD